MVEGTVSMDFAIAVALFVFAYGIFVGCELHGMMTRRHDNAKDK